MDYLKNGTIVIRLLDDQLRIIDSNVKENGYVVTEQDMQMLISNINDLKKLAGIETSAEQALPINSVMPSFDSPKNWTEDYELENGNYICRCSLCKEHFYGYKRRVICKECAKEHDVNGA